MRLFRTFLITLTFCLLFLFFSWRPLWHTDLWGHLAFGRKIVETKSLDKIGDLLTFDPELPLRDTAWLSQVIGYAIHELGGNTGLQMLYAGCITVALLLLWRMFSRDGVSCWLSLIGVGLYLGMSWEQLKIIRPQLGGLICYLLLFYKLTNKTRTLSDWFIIPAIFALWANLHGSFPMGFSMMGCFLVSDLLRSEVSFESENKKKVKILSDRLLLFFVCLIATCLNPYGPTIYKTVFEISTNPNIEDLVEWDPMSLSMYQGRWALAVVILFAIAKLFARRRTDISHWLLLLGTGLATIWSSRMILWFAPAIVYVILLQAQSPKDRKRTLTTESKRCLLTFPFWGLQTVLVISTLFFSPLGWECITGKSQDPHRSLSSETPVEATEYFLEGGGEGIVLNRFEWGDYLIWKTEGRIKPFAFSHAHLIPRDVWRDYLHIIRAGPHWKEKLEQHNIRAVMISPIHQSELFMLLEESSDWKIYFQNERAAIFLRAETTYYSRPDPYHSPLKNE